MEYNNICSTNNIFINFYQFLNLMIPSDKY